MRRRLDSELVRRGILASRSQASDAIERGDVLVSGVIAEKASRMVAPDEPVVLRERLRFASRAGEKLDAALARFDVDVEGAVCLDAGSSTGGFVDCLLQRGAARVHAVDVGRGLIDQRLRDDTRVQLHEGVNARHLDPATIQPPARIVTADVSFISLVTIAPALVSASTADAIAVMLVKPQFEAGPERVGRGGIVRDPQVHREVLEATVAGLADAGWAVDAVMPSPIRGSSGNVEFMVRSRRGPSPKVAGDELRRAVGEAHASESAAS